MRRRAADRPPVLEALPTHLRGFPEQEDHDGPAYRAWSAERTAWCREHGYSVLELLRAEHHRPAPSKKNPSPQPSNTNPRK